MFELEIYWKNKSLNRSILVEILSGTVVMKLMIHKNTVTTAQTALLKNTVIYLQVNSGAYYRIMI